MIKKIQELFAYFESTNFSQRAQIINSLSSFTMSVENSPKFQAAVEMYRLNPKVGSTKVIERINKLLSATKETKYLYKYDAAIAVYLYLLFKLSPSEYSIFAKQFEIPRNSWWTEQMLIVLDKFNKSAEVDYATKSMPDGDSLHGAGTILSTSNSATAILQGSFQ